MANMVVETLSHMYALAKGWDMVPEDCDDPCEAIPMNPKRKRERFLTDAESPGSGRCWTRYRTTAARYRPAR